MINSLFQFHKLNADGIKKAEAIAQLFSDLLSELETNCAPNREFAIVKTKLEEAAFFAKKSMAISPLNQEL